MNNCYNCGSEKLDLSVGAMYGGVSVFCSACGCKGGMSKTEPAESVFKKRKSEAIEIWNKGFIERFYWRHKGAEYFYPPVHFSKIKND